MGPAVSLLLATGCGGPRPTTFGEEGSSDVCQAISRDGGCVIAPSQCCGNGFPSCGKLLFDGELYEGSLTAPPPTGCQLVQAKAFCI